MGDCSLFAKCLLCFRQTLSSVLWSSTCRQALLFVSKRCNSTRKSCRLQNHMGKLHQKFSVVPAERVNISSVYQIVIFNRNESCVGWIRAFSESKESLKCTTILVCGKESITGNYNPNLYILFLIKQITLEGSKGIHSRADLLDYDLGFFSDRED